MNHLANLQRNIRFSYIFNFLLFFRTTNAIGVIYLGFKGLSLTQIGILESIFHLTSFICEVPTGALADIYGRKLSMVLGRIASIISGCLMIVSDSMLGFSLAFVFSGLSYTLNSGAGDSIIYDSLRQTGEEHRYTTISGTIRALSELAQAIAVILGGYLADINFLYAYIAALVVNTLAIVVAAGITEPHIIKGNQQRQGLSEHMRSSCQVLLGTKAVLYLMIYFSIITATGTTVYFYCQKHFATMGYSNTAIATIFTIDSLVRALCAQSAHQVESKLKQPCIILAMLVLNISGLLGLAMSNGLWNVMFFYAISIIEGAGYPIFGYYINSLIPSEQRATILSMESTIFSICMIVIFPLVGIIGDMAGLRTAFGTLALVLVPAMLAVMYRINRTGIKKQSKV
jgi:MFS family permease